MVAARTWKPAAKLSDKELALVREIGKKRGSRLTALMNVYRRHGFITKAARVMDARYQDWKAGNRRRSCEPQWDSSYTVAAVLGRSPRTIANVWAKRSWA